MCEHSAQQHSVVKRNCGQNSQSHAPIAVSHLSCKKTISTVFSPLSMANPEFDDTFWVNHIPDLQKAHITTWIHLVFLLICFLKVSVLQLLTFTFQSDIKPVKDKVSIFMGYSPSASPRVMDRFPPAHMLDIWSTQWPNCLISDKRLHISFKDITAERIQNILKPKLLTETYREWAPFVFDILHTFASASNLDPYQTRKAKIRKAHKDMHVDPETNQMETTIL